LGWEAEDLRVEAQDLRVEVIIVLVVYRYVAKIR
jgi:hypothetical protein